MIDDSYLKKYLLVISILLFAVSLTQKAYCTTANCADSFMVALLGWAAILTDPAGFTWFANPLLWASWLLLRKNLKAAMFLSVCATFLSGAFLLVGSIKDNEGGISHQINAYRLGYWLWTGSCICMLIGTFWLMLRHNTRRAVG